jgi:hypothetical protein
MGVMNWKRPTATKGTMKHGKTSFSTEIFAGATISVVQYLAPLRYAKTGALVDTHQGPRALKG